MLDRYFAFGARKVLISRDSFPNLSDQQFQDYSTLAVRAKKLAFVLHGLTQLRTIVNADRTDWTVESLTPENMKSILLRHKLKSMMMDDRVTVADFRPKMREALNELVSEKGLRYGLGPEASSSEVLDPQLTDGI